MCVVHTLLKADLFGQAEVRAHCPGTAHFLEMLIGPSASLLEVYKEILPWGNIKGFPDISQRNRCTHVWFEKNGGYECHGHSPHIIAPAQLLHVPLRKLPSSVITVSAINLNALVWNFRFLHNLAPTDLFNDIMHYTHSRSCQTKPLAIPWSSTQALCLSMCFLWFKIIFPYNPNIQILSILKVLLICQSMKTFFLPEMGFSSHSYIFPLQGICVSLMVLPISTLNQG